MNYFISTLKLRNETLFYFGIICLLLAIIFIVVSKFSSIEVLGLNAWIKPFKFAFSTFLYAWAMAWFIGYLPNFNATVFNWIIVVTLGFEIIYITFQAAKGQLSHFNLTTPAYATLYSLMAIAASIATIATGYIGVKFFTLNVTHLPTHYLWSIRLGIFIFVVFAFQGFIMGGRLTHTVGGTDGGDGIAILNWSKKQGDLRIAHFIGMHALQVLPVISYYILKNTKVTIALGIGYCVLAVFTLVQALQAKPFYKF